VGAWIIELISAFLWLPYWRGFAYLWILARGGSRS
jgi:hypothetical protein